MNRRSLAVQLGVWHALLLTATFLLAGALSYVVLRHSLLNAAYDGVRRHSAQVESILQEAPADASPDYVAHEVELRLAPEFNNQFIRVTRRSGALLFQSGKPSGGYFDPALIPRVPGSQAGAYTILGSQHLLIRALQLATRSGDYWLEVGTSTHVTDQVLEQLTLLLAVLLPVLLVCATLGGLLLVRRALLDVDRIAETAAQISVRNLALRIPVVHGGDALERLSNALNMMLNRLSESVQLSRRFVADASHELRTPLTLIRLELHELVDAPHMSAGEVRDRVGSVLEEVSRLEQLVAGLLAMSRLDAGDSDRLWIDVEISALVVNTAEQMRLLAEENGVEIDLSKLEPAIIWGDPARLRQVIVNLLDNALRFTLRGGRVTIITCSDASGVVLEVTDTGVGIPPQALPHVFDRFFRVDEARGRDQGGGGIGLSIVKAICQLYEATIDVRSVPGQGSSFRIHFPRRTRAAATPLEPLRAPSIDS